MEAQDFHSLQEAYMEVVENQQLDEELTGARRERAQELIKSKQTPSGKAKSGQKEKIGLITRVAVGGPHKGLHRTYKGGISPTSGKTAKGAKNIPLYGSGNKSKRRRGIDVPDTRNEQVDIYDIILSHLLDEGYADTNENALVIMVNMSEEWRESIVEGLGGAKNQGDYDEREKERQSVRDKHLEKYKSGELPFQKQKKADKAQKFLKKHPKKTK